MSSVLLLLIGLCLFFCSFFFEEWHIEHELVSYEIDPIEIREALDRGEANQFAPIDRETIDEFYGARTQILWHANDYFRVAEAMLETIWHEPANHWKLNRIDFLFECEDLGLGPRRGDLRYVQEIDDVTFYESDLSIYPTRHLALGHLKEYRANMSQRNYQIAEIPIDELLISAMSAVRVAEQNGGLAIRARVENRCEVWVVLDAGRNGYRSWRVAYQPIDRIKDLATFRIDPATGELND